MAEPLWSWRDLIAATRGRPEGEAHAGLTGVSIDTRTLQPGDLFVALRGDNQDGHAYVSKAFKKGAAAALVAEDFVTPAGAGPLVRVSDSTRDPSLAALERLGVAARSRLSPEARVIAVTGSVGKTSTKEMLRVCLTSVDPHTHASEKSYNNHWGVPLTLARMPRDTRYGVFEIGMNHPGEITPLTKMVRPHVAIITTVGPVHLGFFKSVEEIADAKAEIFAGLEVPEMGSDPMPNPLNEQCQERGLTQFPVAVLNADIQYYDRLAAAALQAGAKARRFGTEVSFDFSLEYIFDRGEKAEVRARILDQRAVFTLDWSAVHQVRNAIAALGACRCLDVDVAAVVAALNEFSQGEGRGQRTTFDLKDGQIVLIDESYNANPISMEGVLVSHSRVASRTHGPRPRAIAVLGDMRELGQWADQLHAELADPVKKNSDVVFLCGEHMRALRDRLAKDTSIPVTWEPKSTDLIPHLLKSGTVQPGDVIMVKGSLGTNMKPIVDALKAHLTRLAAGRA